MHFFLKNTQILAILFRIGVYCGATCTLVGIKFENGTKWLPKRKTSCLYVDLFNTILLLYAIK